MISSLYLTPKGARLDRAGHAPYLPCQFSELQNRASARTGRRSIAHWPPDVYAALRNSDAGSDTVESMRTSMPVCAGNSTSLPFFAAM